VPLLANGARVILTASADPRPVLPAQAYNTRDISIRGFAISNASVSDLAAAAKTINARLADGTLKARVGARLEGGRRNRRTYRRRSLIRAFPR